MAMSSTTGLSAQQAQRIASGQHCSSSGASIAPRRRPSLPSALHISYAGAGPSARTSRRPRGALDTKLAPCPAPSLVLRGPRRGDLQVVAGGGGGKLGASSGAGPNQPIKDPVQGLLVGTAVTYMGLIVVFPFLNVFIEAFRHGTGPFFETLVDPDFLQSVKMTLLLSAVAVPINTVFGICAALLLARNDFPAKPLVISILDLPFSISPVVTGMMLVLLYGRKGLFAPLIAQYGFPIVFAFPGMALATLFVTMPFVVRELLPILEAMDMAEEEAARSLGANPIQTFWNVTLPNIRWGLLYGVILTNARAMGEFGAVSVISGNIIGQTQTLTLFVESSYKEYNSEAAFAAAVLLSLLALATLIIKEKVEEAASIEK
jgi:sulfate transport system permease protein